MIIYNINILRSFSICSLNFDSPFSVVVRYNLTASAAPARTNRSIRKSLYKFDPSMHICFQHSSIILCLTLHASYHLCIQTYIHRTTTMKQDSFVVRRRNPELVAPARATPRETKPLSDLDNDWFLRYIQPCLELFRAVDDDDGHHHHRRRPADAIKAALAEALVYYYPMAGRLREQPNGKLSVECTGERVVFVEAEADVRIEDMGEPPMPLFRGSDEFLCDVGDAKVIVGRPLFFMQVKNPACVGWSLLTSHKINLSLSL